VDSNYALFVQAEGYASADMEGLSAAPGRTIQVADFRLKKGFTLFGRVTNSTGSPLAGAEVSAVDKRREMVQMSKEAICRKVQTREDGGYTLPCLSKSQYEITFSAPGYRALTVTENFILSSDGEAPRTLDATLDPSGLTIQGIIFGPSNRPIVDAEIHALFSSPGKNAHFTAETRSDPEGNFTLPGLSEGRYTLNASAKGFFQKDHLSAAAGEEGVTILLSPTGAVEGVLQAAGKLPRKYAVCIDSF
jgi:hypothetical protein